MNRTRTAKGSPIDPTPQEQAAPTQATTTSTDLVIPSKEELLAPIAAARKEIEQAVEEGKALTIEGHVDGKKAGYAAVSAHRKKLKNLNVAVEKARVGAKKPVLDLERAVDGLASRLKAIIIPELTRLEKLEKDYEAEVAREKAQKAQAAADLLRKRIDQLRTIGAGSLEIDTNAAQNATEEEWAIEVERVTAEVTKRRLLTQRTEALRAVGASAPFGVEDWSEEQFDELLEKAIDDKRQRDEQVAEQARLAEVKRETSRRLELLQLLGVDTTYEACEAMSREEFDELLSKKREERRIADEDAARIRREAASRPAAPIPAPTPKPAVLQLDPEPEAPVVHVSERDALAAWRQDILSVLSMAPDVEELAEVRDSVIRAVEAALEPIDFTTEEELLPEMTLEF